MNWRPSLGQEGANPFSIFRPETEDISDDAYGLPFQPSSRLIQAPAEPRQSMFAVLTPREKIERARAAQEPPGNMFEVLRPRQKVERPLPTSDAPAASMFEFLRSKEPEARRNFFPPAGPVGGDPFSAIRPVGGDPFSRMSGPGEKTCILHNPAFWLIAAVGTFVALEATGVTNFSKSLK